MQAHLMAFSKTQEEPAQQESFPYGDSAELHEDDDEAASSSQQAMHGLALSSSRQHGCEAGQAQVHTHCWGQGWSGLPSPCWILSWHFLGHACLSMALICVQNLGEKVAMMLTSIHVVIMWPIAKHCLL